MKLIEFRTRLIEEFTPTAKLNIYKRVAYYIIEKRFIWGAWKLASENKYNFIELATKHKNQMIKGTFRK